MIAETVVTLPAGIWLDGEQRRELTLRTLNGEDEAFLLDLGDGVLPAKRASALLGRCLAPVGAQAGIDLARCLTIGDREALMLHLHRLVSGERIECIVRCPAADCGEQLEITLRASELLVPIAGETPPNGVHEVTIDDGARPLRVRFRVPTGADQEAAAELVRRNDGDAVQLLLRRCVVDVSADGESLGIGALSSRAIERLSAALADSDPQAEIELTLTCPSCSTSFETLFDATAFLFSELDQRIGQLYREVHTLALHYHWSERDVLGMPRARRDRYLTLLADTHRARTIA